MPADADSAEPALPADAEAAPELPLPAEPLAAPPSGFAWLEQALATIKGAARISRERWVMGTMLHSDARPVRQRVVNFGQPEAGIPH